MKSKLFMLAAALCLTACSSEEDSSQNERRDIILTRAEQEIVAENANFAFRFFKEMNKGEEQFAISPLSASYALSMLATGAEGETKREIIDALGFEGMEMTDVNNYHKKMKSELPALDRSSRMSIANSLWLNQAVGFKPLNSYKEALGEYYDAEVREYDFRKGPDAINTWCAEKTNNCIPEILKDLSPDMRMLLMNALYYKADWADPFKEGLTQKELFTNEDDSQILVDMMNKEDTRKNFIETDRFALAEFPYGNKAFSLQVLLPIGEATLSDCIESLDGAEWLALQSQMQLQRMSVKLPKFKIECEAILTGILQTLGIQTCFTGAADFSNLSQEVISVSMVKQVNYFSVDEKGVEAAAVTAIGETGLPGPDPNKSYPFHANKAFLFILKENSTNTILFMGKVGKME